MFQYLIGTLSLFVYFQNILQHQHQWHQLHHWHANCDQAVEEAQSSSSSSSLFAAATMNAINKLNRPRHHHQEEEQLKFSRHRRVQSCCAHTIESLSAGPVAMTQQKSTSHPPTLPSPPPSSASPAINNTCKEEYNGDGGGDWITTTTKPHSCCKSSNNEITTAAATTNNYGQLRRLPCKNDCDIAKSCCCFRCRRRWPTSTGDHCRLITVNNVNCTGPFSSTQYQTISDFSEKKCSAAAPNRKNTKITEDRSERRRNRSRAFQFSVGQFSVKTIYGQCLAMIYIFFMYLSMYSCMAARQEGKFLLKS